MALVQTPASDQTPLPPPSVLRRFLFAVGVLAMLCLFSAPLYQDNNASDAPVPRLGKVSYAGWSDWAAPVSLAGSWRLVWRSPSLPQGPAAGDVAVVRVPGVWAGAPMQGRPGVGAPRWGLATYELTLQGVPPGAYTLFVPTIDHATRVWVNGRLASSTGVVGSTAAATRYQWRAQRVAIDADGSDLRLAIDVAAFHHFSDGLEGAPSFGSAQVMESRLAKESAQQLFFIVTLIILFFYGAIVFAFRSRDYPSLFFALACVTLAPTAMVIGHDDLLTLLYPALSFPAHMAVEYLTCIVSFMCLLAYAALLFPRENARIVFWIFEGVLGMSLLVIAVALARGDTVLASLIDRYPIFLGGAELAYIIGVVFLATLRGRDGAAVFLLGMTVFAGSIIEAMIVEYDILPRDQVIGYDWAPMGLLVFAVSHIIILAERWSLAMDATETMARDLRRLMEVSSSVTSEIRLDALLRNVVEATSRFLNADRGALFLYEAKTDELRSVVAEGLGTREIRVPAGTGIAGASFRGGAASLVEDAYADPRFNRAIDDATGYRTRGMVSLPIVTRDGRRLGVMQALNRRDGRPFGEADIDRMRAFAAHAAVALHNATLFSEIVAARNYNDSILASMSGGVITLNEDGGIETINPAAAAILEVADPGGLRGQAARSVLTGANAWLLDEFDAVRREGDGRALLDVEVQTAAARTISANISIIPLINEGASAGLLVLFEDISQEKRLKGAMRRFMTQKVVDQVLQREDDLMFGAACVASVLFADIRGFTSMAENLEARETVNMLNEVFADLVEAVSGHDGVVDKFIGDAVMAVFGAPLSSGRDPQNAVQSANVMLTMVGVLNQRRTARGDPPLRLGVGVATGELIAGTIGSPKRMDYTVIGDSVNVASRLQDLTKHYRVGVIVCEATALANDGQILRRLDTVVIRGRNRPERIYQLMTYHTEETFPRLAEVLAAYQRGLASLEGEEWRGAVDAFTAALALNPDDHPSELMLARARAGLASRADDWSEAGWSTPPVVSAS